MILPVAIGAALGAGIGYGYYRLVGCPDGTCPLTRNPWVSALYWALIGGLLATTL